jgi:hypothetical protein
VDDHVKQVVREVAASGVLVGAIDPSGVMVHQEVTGEVAGFVLGALRLGRMEGRTVVEQNVDTLSGRMVGVALGSVGKKADPLAKLRDYLLADTPPSRKRANK